jgi:hypothetical protein
MAMIVEGLMQKVPPLGEGGTGRGLTSTEMRGVEGGLLAVA